MRRALWVGLFVLALVALDCATTRRAPRLQRRARETHRITPPPPRPLVPARVRPSGGSPWP